MTLPLSGLLVVSLEQAVAVPMCTCRLADAGARVIKIERPEGDFARGYDDLVHGECSYFVWLNRGKESVVLDLAKPADKALLAAIEPDEIAAFAVHEIVIAARKIAFRPLDLDHPRAGIGEAARAHWRRDCLFERNDKEAGQREGHVPSIRPWQAEHMLGDIGQHEIG